MVGGNKILFYFVFAGLALIVLMIVLLNMPLTNQWFSAADIVPVPSKMEISTDTSRETDNVDWQTLYPYEEIQEPTPSVTENNEWAMFDGKMHGFPVSFAYPSDWQIVKLEDPQAGIALRSPNFDPANLGGNVMSNGEIYINTAPNPGNEDFQTIFEWMNDTSRFWFDRFAHKETVINELPTIIFEEFRETSSGPFRRLSMSLADNYSISIAELYKNKGGQVPQVFEAIQHSIHGVKPIWRIYEVNTKLWQSTEIELEPYDLALEYPQQWTVTRLPGDEPAVSITSPVYYSLLNGSGPSYSEASLRFVPIDTNGNYHNAGEYYIIVRKKNKNFSLRDTILDWLNNNYNDLEALDPKEFITPAGAAMSLSGIAESPGTPWLDAVLIDKGDYVLMLSYRYWRTPNQQLSQIFSDIAYRIRVK